MNLNSTSLILLYNNQIYAQAESGCPRAPLPSFSMNNPHCTQLQEGFFSLHVSLTIEGRRRRAPTWKLIATWMWRHKNFRVAGGVEGKIGERRAGRHLGERGGGVSRHKEISGRRGAIQLSVSIWAACGFVKLIAPTPLPTFHLPSMACFGISLDT